MTEIRIGTSGWHYDHWIGNWYPKDVKSPEMFDRYAETFDCVEINNTFYRLPTDSAVEGWREAAPPDFRFAIKGSRFITHMKKLKDPKEPVRRFFEAIEPLRDVAGPVVFQLPPRWKKNVERLDEFLSVLPDSYRYAFELRDRSWLEGDVVETLRRHGAAFCIYDLRGFQSPIEVTTDFVYVRLHGPSERAYEGSYGDDTLHEWAERIEHWRASMESVWIFFDNDQKAHAPSDAARLKQMLGLAD
ncbi:MAG: DUF72 domain-containing protein [Acidobacteria bacterium]|nr:DUF72 domain-containing protein [Acidobacteriota bacterium]